MVSLHSLTNQKGNMEMQVLSLFLLALGLIFELTTTEASQVQNPPPSHPLISRETLFGNPDVDAVRVSPDGRWLSWLAPHQGYLNIWIAPINKLENARVITSDHKRGIRKYSWLFTGEDIAYLQDEGGNENWRINIVNTKTNDILNLTPFDKVRAEILKTSSSRPIEILIKLNKRDAKFHDVYLANIRTGELKLVEENLNQYADFVATSDLKVMIASQMKPDGGAQFFKKDAEGKFQLFVDTPAEDAMTTSVVGFSRSAERLYMIESAGTNTAALIEYDEPTGTRTQLALDERSDTEGFLINPISLEPEAVTFNYETRKWRALSPEAARSFEFLREKLGDDFSVLSQSQDNQLWTLVQKKDNGPSPFYLFNRQDSTLRFLMVNRKALSGLPLAPMRPLVIEARDGLKLVSYLTLPASLSSDQPESPLPMVLFVHGGPWARDSWGFHPFHQLFANRGYAVLSVNFRGSTGFGKSFINAANLEWGRKMHDDLIDAVNWAVESGIADRKKIAIMGGSYGGYATLAGLTFTPDVFACGIDVVGPSNLITLLESIPPYWEAQRQNFYTRMGDPRTPEGRRLLADRSPVNHAEKITKPLLIVQGANDPRVKQAESDQIVEALSNHKIPVTYVLYPDEGHGFARPANNLSFVAVTEAFLARHLGGRSEPIGESFRDSTIQILVGGEELDRPAPVPK